MIQGNESDNHKVWIIIVGITHGCYYLHINLF